MFKSENAYYNKFKCYWNGQSKLRSALPEYQAVLGVFYALLRTCAVAVATV